MRLDRSSFFSLAISSRSIMHSIISFVLSNFILLLFIQHLWALTHLNIYQSCSYHFLMYHSLFFSLLYWLLIQFFFHHITSPHILSLVCIFVRTYSIYTDIFTYYYLDFNNNIFLYLLIFKYKKIKGVEKQPLTYYFTFYFNDDLINTASVIVISLLLSSIIYEKASERI